MPRPRILYLASGNGDKAAEFAALAHRDRLHIEIRAAGGLGGMPPVPEDTGTFAGNARQKAQALRRQAPAGSWVLADDSGLCVDALGGAPGVDSAIYAGRHLDAAGNRAKLLGALEGMPSERRAAHFFCLLLLLEGDDGERIFEGRCHGRIASAERGGGGFGYDPLFEVEGRTFAEMTESTKNRISHRARAWAAFASWVRGLPPAA
ncbi:MAG: RdgB/HAM1 family non-canonical purine NTP pyrophosphatase [Opitutaceae bacterium]